MARAVLCGRETGVGPFILEPNMFLSGFMLNRADARVKLIGFKLQKLIDVLALEMVGLVCWKIDWVNCSIFLVRM